MLYKWIRDHVGKFSFIVKTEFKNATFYMWYEKDGKLKAKHLPYRANKDMLLYTIGEIKKDINYDEQKKKYDKKVNAALKKEQKKETIFKIV